MIGFWTKCAMILCLSAMLLENKPVFAGERSSNPANLKNVGDDQIVQWVVYDCERNYIIFTKGGNRIKGQEFSVYFKTDGSNYGPSHGRPVVIQAGHGDKLYVIFSSFQELVGRLSKMENYPCVK